MSGRCRRIILATAFSLLTAIALSCGGGSSSAPAPTAPTPTVSSISVSGIPGTIQPGQTSQLTATANFTNNTTQTCTSNATWASSNTAVATVSSAGLMTAVAQGSADIRATYSGMTGTGKVTVSAPPVFTLYGVVSEVDSTTTKVAGASLQVVDGPNANKGTTTDGNGYYSIPGLLGSSFTLRATHSNYELTDNPVGLSGDKRLDFSMKRSSAPPPPPPPPKTCCKYCTTGKPCGDSCIAKDEICHITGGCACGAAFDSR